MFRISQVSVSLISLLAVHGVLSQAPDSDDVCVVADFDNGIFYYRSNGYWERDDYWITVLDDYNTWVFYENGADLSSASNVTLITDLSIIAYCSNMTDDYTPSSDAPGDPSDCITWTPLSSGNEVESVDTDRAECYGIDTSLSWIDYVYLGYGAFAVAAILVCRAYYKCCSGSGDRWSKEYYTSAMLATYTEIMKLHGIEKPSEKRSDKDDRSVDEAFLVQDIVEGKVVWEDDWWKDWSLYLLMNHSLLSVVYGHDYDVYTRKERLYGLLYGLIASLSLTIWITFFVAIFNIDSNELAFFVALSLDILLGYFVSWAMGIYENAAACRCCQKKSQKTRKRAEEAGKCVIYLLVLTNLCVFILSAVLAWIIVQDYVASLDGVTDTFLTNFATGLIFSWFLIDLIALTGEFDHEWHKQKGVQYEPNAYNIIWKWGFICHCTNACCFAWICCGSCLCYGPYRYYKNKHEKIVSGKEDKGCCCNCCQKEEEESGNPEFCITYEDYDNYNKYKEDEVNNPFPQRKMDYAYGLIGVEDINSSRSSHKQTMSRSGTQLSVAKSPSAVARPVTGPVAGGKNKTEQDVNIAVELNKAKDNTGEGNINDSNENEAGSPEIIMSKE